MSFLREDRPELAGSLAQMALCSKPSTNELIERWEGKGRVSVIYKEEGQGIWKWHKEYITTRAPG